MRSKGFTLIELLIVMIIISILIGMIMGGTRVAIRNAKKEQAKGDIASLENAIDMYKTDVGSYPAYGGSGNNFKSWLLDNNGSSGWNGPYMFFDKNRLSGNSFKDPWGRAYNYRCPGINHNPPNHTKYFDIWSNGPDGSSGTADDITNW